MKCFILEKKNTKGDRKRKKERKGKRNKSENGGETEIRQERRMV